MTFTDFDDALLLNDKQIGQLLGFSPQWVRQQRMLRRRKQRHVLTLDPIHVGPKPRYLKDEVLAWFEKLKAAARPSENHEPKS